MTFEKNRVIHLDHYRNTVYAYTPCMSKAYRYIHNNYTVKPQYSGLSANQSPQYLSQPPSSVPTSDIILASFPDHYQFINVVGEKRAALKSWEWSENEANEIPYIYISHAVAGSLSILQLLCSHSSDHYNRAPLYY